MKIVNPLKTFACLAVLTAAICGTASSARASEALQKGMLYDKAYSVAVACIRAAGAFTSVRKGKSKKRGGSDAAVDGAAADPSAAPTPSPDPDIRPNDALDAVGIKTEFHLDALRAYLMLNERIGVPSVYRYDEAIEDVRPYLIDGEALADISTKTTVADLAAIISANAGAAMLPFSTIEGIIADCRYKVAKKSNEVDSDVVVADDLGNPTVHPFMICVADHEPDSGADNRAGNNWNDAPGSTGLETVSLRGPNGRRIYYVLEPDLRQEIESGLICDTIVEPDCRNWTYRQLTLAIALQAEARIPSSLVRTTLIYKIVLAYLPQSSRENFKSGFASFSRNEIDMWLPSARFESQYECRVDSTRKVTCSTPPPGRQQKVASTGPKRLFEVAAAPRSETPRSTRRAAPPRDEVGPGAVNEAIPIKPFTKFEDLFKFAEEALPKLRGDR